jgi:hypothetical protein
VIDPDWFESICDLAEVEVAGFDRERLPELLGEVGEVLPFVLVHGGGFADWPVARAALSQAIRSFPRARDARPEAGPGDLAGPLPSPDRRTLYDRMRRTLVGSDVHWRPDWEERGIHVEDLLGTIKAVRLDERRGDDNPSMFIMRD